jgi:hypothetical protein
MLRRGRGERQDFLPNGNLRYRGRFSRRCISTTQSKTKVRAGAFAFSWGRSRLMPEWMASGTLAFLLALAGGFAAHYTLLTLGIMH